MTAPLVAPVALAVAEGLAATPKRLPPWLFYDDAGSALFEAITALPEYYLTRAEREILGGLRLRGPPGGLSVVELGAGTATKSQQVLARLPGPTRFYPVDVSPAALDVATARLARELPSVEVVPLVCDNLDALRLFEDLPGRRLILFLGSSIGNLDEADAITLLRSTRRALGDDGRLVLGTDLRKDPRILLPAYDDADGVTAAFNRNVLARINRELGGHFAIERFRHVALWNDPLIEMHLESEGPQEVRIDALGTTVRFAAGERIHTESSAKYDLERVDALLRSAGLRRLQTATDARAWYALHLVETDRRRAGARDGPDAGS